MTEQIVYLNGEFIPLSEARVSVFDRGFLFGDAVYEVIPAYGGHLFRLEEHLTRLDNSLRGIRMQNPLSHQEWRALLERLGECCPDEDQSLYLQVTRGVGNKRDHGIPKVIQPTVFAMANPMNQPAPEVYAEGISVITLDDIRWQLCNIKATTLLANVLARSQASDEGAAEAILVRDGKALEGAASNLFIINNGLIITPPKSPLLLPGITRDLVLELADDAGIPWCEADIHVTELVSADEIWMTSSTKEILPVTMLNGNPVGDGRPGPRWEHMTTLYRAYIQLVRG